MSLADTPVKLLPVPPVTLIYHSACDTKQMARYGLDADLGGI